MSVNYQEKYPLIDIFTLDDHLVDLNQPEKIPKEILDMYWEIKNEIGSSALGIVFYPDVGWSVVDSMAKVYAHFK